MLILANRSELSRGLYTTLGQLCFLVLPSPFDKSTIEYTLNRFFEIRDVLHNGGYISAISVKDALNNVASESYVL